MFLQLVGPVWVNGHCSVVGISSPQDGLNPMARLVHAVDPEGKQIAKVIEAGQPCAACVRAGRAAECIHRRKPAWRDTDKEAKMHSIYRFVLLLLLLMLIANRQVGAKGTAGRELLGMSATDGIFIFSEFVETFRALPPHVFNNKVTVLESFIDPSSTGTHSDFMVVDQVWQDGRHVVSPPLAVQ